MPNNNSLSDKLILTQERYELILERMATDIYAGIASMAEEFADKIKKGEVADIKKPEDGIARFASMLRKINTSKNDEN